MKAIGKAEAIRVNPMRDKNLKSGVMFAIHPPFSLRAKFKKEYGREDITWASNSKELTEIINTITKWKLSKK